GYYYAVKRLRYETEAAYLALYDDGQALRILPVCSLLSCGGIDEGRETFGVQPWGSFQMITTAGEAFVKRFFDPQFQAPAAQKQAEKKPVDTDLIHISTAPRAAGANETDAGKPQGTDIKDELESAAVSNNPLDAINESVRVLSTTKPDKEDEKKESADEEQPADGETPEDKDGKPLTEAEKKQKAEEKKLQDEMFAKPASEEELIFEEETTAQQHSGFINAVRTDFGMLLSTYVTQGVEYGDTQFSPRASSLKNVIQAAAAKIEPSREQIADIQDPIVTDLLKKTAYPVTNVLVREYNYTRFEPFYWMFIFGAAAAVLGLCAFFCGSVRRDMIGIPSYSVYLTADSIRDAEQRPDYTNTFEEFLNTAAAAMLLLSVLITFIGGAMRASITGWAPVTNMYETIVFTAFCAGLFGLWYSLYPLLQPVLQIGWHYARFPSLYLMIKLLTEKKTDVTARGENETEGEFAMRQAAADFGVMHHDTPHRIQDEQESEKTRQESLAKVRLIWQGSLMPFRLVLMYAVFYGIVMLCSGHYAAEHGLWAAAQNMLAVNDVIDMLVIVICWSAAVWYLPRFILMFVPVPFMLLQPRIIASELGIVSYKTDTPAAATASGVYASAPDIHPLSDVRHSEFSSVFAGEHIQQTAAAASTDNSGSVWFTMARNGILERKLFIVIAAAVLVLAGLAAYLNSAEFNPEIRPIAAVLRSNFWLTVHVIAIVASYAAAFVAWGISIAALGSVVFGKFQRTAADLPNGKVRVQLPVMSRQCSPIINKLLKLSLLLLIIGTVLGARWADYSWGRFWSWDPKEVWALITIMFYVMVLHGVIARWYGQIGVMVGALFASIAVIITWYGINFVFKGSMHSYGSGSADNAKLFLGIFIVANLLWGTLAILRYTAETYSSERDNQN
ncbi:MAG: cytochrome c biogenesis protein CcsA, partial [Planctomycetaceae bacterium]|nr:cytochrome c biogenesis protein CcsA [Planctomycetaceae bacterium]